MRLMGIDFGDARVGIALSDPLGIMAQGYETLDNDGTDSLFYKIQSIIKEKEVTTIVIGLPKNMDNSEGFRADTTKEFAQKLKSFTDAKIEFCDERLTTVSAHGMKKTEKDGFYTALDVGCVWLERALNSAK